MKRLLLLAAIGLSGCATNSNIDHKIVCDLNGNASYVVTYGPIAFTEPVADASPLCPKLSTTTTAVVIPAAVSASSPAK